MLQVKRFPSDGAGMLAVERVNRAAPKLGMKFKAFGVFRNGTSSHADLTSLTNANQGIPAY